MGQRGTQTAGRSQLLHRSAQVQQMTVQHNLVWVMRCGNSSSGPRWRDSSPEWLSSAQRPSAPHLCGSESLHTRCFPHCWHADHEHHSALPAAPTFSQSTAAAVLGATTPVLPCSAAPSRASLGPHRRKALSLWSPRSPAVPAPSRLWVLQARGAAPALFSTTGRREAAAAWGELRGSGLAPVHKEVAEGPDPSRCCTNRCSRARRDERSQQGAAAPTDGGGAAPSRPQPPAPRPAQRWGCAHIAGGSSAPPSAAPPRTAPTQGPGAALGRRISLAQHNRRSPAACRSQRSPALRFYCTP